MANFFTVGASRPHNRKDKRHDMPRLSLKIGDRHFTTFDWSMGGFRIPDFKGRPPVGEVLRLSELSYSGDKGIPVSCEITVTRVVLGKNQVAFSFKSLDDQAFDFLEKASLQRLAILSQQS
ncbi:MAG: PilZ domain-containing protein [Sneathiella sp.]|nr:PilZ domain-containing protein [Sneathiella sp.]